MADPAQKTNEAQPEKQVKDNDEQHYIGDYETAPGYMKDNDNITHGYRVNFNTPRKIFRSLFMLHNESVNIWSHCLPAIFIIIFIATFYFVMDGEAVKRSLQGYQDGIKSGVDHYMHALHNLSVIAEYDKFSQRRKQQIVELQQTVLNNYAEFTKKFHETSKQYQDLFDAEVEGMKTSIKEILHQNTAQFERAKRQFQKNLAPLMLQNINDKLDSAWFNELKRNVQKLKKEIDNNEYYFNLLHQQLPNPQEISRWPIVLFLITAAMCMLCSTIFHLFHPMSSRTYLITNRFDYAGINLLISGSAFPPLYYGMYCNFDVAIIYLTLILIVACCCFVICLFEWIHRPGHEHYKGWLFAGFGISLGIPVAHMVINEIFYENYGDPFVFTSSVPYIALLGASYLGGVYIYVVRCPERNRPGKYNVCGHSHQIWHGLVVLGVFFTYMAAISNFEMRKVSMCPAPAPI